MCGIVGIISQTKTNIIYEIVEGLLSLQHRGQDSCGISNGKNMIKDKGYAMNVFDVDKIEYLSSNIGIGHVRYATTKLNDVNQVQPFSLKLNFKATLVHNGNIINVEEIRNILKTEFKYESDSNSDSELVLQLFMAKLFRYEKIDEKVIFSVSDYLQNVLIGSYCLLIIIDNVGLVCIRDKFGIRPLQIGYHNEGKSYIFCSESGVFGVLGYKFLRDVMPGETIFICSKSFYYYSAVTNKSILVPCLFEYLYFARPDSLLNSISVHQSRIKIGRLLGNKIKKIKEEMNLNIDYLVPVPDTSRIFATGVGQILNDVEYAEALVKNRYIDRTFILENKKQINKNIRRKLSTVDYLLKDRDILIIDDSIVRGNTMRYVVSILKNAGVKKIYLGSASPPIKFANNFGIFIESPEECIANGRIEKEIEKVLGIDKIIYNNLEEIIDELKKMNKNIVDFETSMFNNELCYKKY